MSDYTPAEIEAAFENDEDGWGEVAYSNDGSKSTVTLRGASVQVEKVGGKAPGEGGGEEVSVVIRAGDQLFEKSGYYASHYGADWDGDVREVQPVERTITVYEAV